MTNRIRPPRAIEVLAARNDPRLLAAREANPDSEWRDRAACRGLDAFSEVFFPRPNADPGPALAWCGPCPVRAECLAWALLHRAADGVWGGTTEEERRAMAVAWRQLNNGARRWVAS
jgi:hypothetical protein